MHWLQDFPAVEQPQTMGGAFEALASIGLLGPQLAANLKRAVGFRNLAVYGYDAIDWRIVHAACKM